MGELHLDIVMDRMEREFGIRANLGKPQVAYKETIQTSAEGEGKYIKQTGGKGQYGHCRISIEPLGRGSGFKFEDATRGGIIPREFVRDVETGIREAMEAGFVAGFPVTDLRAVLLDGSYHEVDSTPIAYKIAGSLAVKEAAKKADPAILEPIMNLEVVAPDEYLGDIVGDINSRRGRIDGMEIRAGARVIRIFVPMSEMFGYATILRTLTQGRGVFTMEFHKYEKTPAAVQEDIIARIEGRTPFQR
jgi:elongation factor G